MSSNREHSLPSSSCADGAQLRQGKKQWVGREAEGQLLGQESISKC